MIWHIHTRWFKWQTCLHIVQWFKWTIHSPDDSNSENLSGKTLLGRSYFLKRFLYIAKKKRILERNGVWWCIQTPWKLAYPLWKMNLPLKLVPFQGDIREFSIIFSSMVYLPTFTYIKFPINIKRFFGGYFSPRFPHFAPRLGYFAADLVLLSQCKSSVRRVGIAAGGWFAPNSSGFRDPDDILD